MNNLCNNLNRQTWIDAAKGFGIILVIMGHTFNVNPLLYKFIYSFHMPMFFIISGFLFNSKKYCNMKFSRYIKIKAKNYLIPYFLYSFINLLILVVWKYIFYRQIISFKEVIDYIFAILYCYAGDNRMPNCSSVWFLMCLFWSSILFWLLCKYARKYIFVFALLSMSISYLLSLFLDYRLPFNISTAFMAVFFMWIGYLLRNYNLINKITELDIKIYTILFILMISVGLSAAYFNTQVGMNENNYGHLLLFLFSSILLSISVMAFSNKFKFFRNRYFTYLGKNTMLVIGFNFIVRDFVTELYYFLPISRIIPLNWMLSFVITTLAFTIIIFVHNKIKSIFKRRYIK